MATIAFIDAGGVTRYLEADGLGTTVDPFRPKQSIRFISSAGNEAVVDGNGSQKVYLVDAAGDILGIDSSGRIVSKITDSNGDELLIDSSGRPTVRIVDAAGDEITVDDGGNLNVSVQTNAAQGRLISQCIDSVGNGTGTTNLIGDYSGAATTFKIAPGAGEIYNLTRLIVFIRDGGNFNTTGYGGIAAGTITNGVVIEYDHVDDGGTPINLTGGIPLIDNGIWSSYCYDMRYDSFGTGDNSVSIRWTFSKHGQNIRLIGDNSEELRVILNDNFSGLTSHHFEIQGYIE